MTNWRKLCGVITLAVLLVLLGINMGGSPIVHYELKSKTLAYLQENDTPKTDIAKLKTVYRRNEEPKYVAQCTLNGSEITRYYGFDAEGKIRELGENDI